MNKFNVKQYLFYANNSAVNFNIGGRMGDFAGKATGSGGNVTSASGRPVADANKSGFSRSTAAPGRKDTGSYAVSPAAWRQEPLEASKRDVDGIAASAATAGKSVYIKKNNVAASAMPSASTEKNKASRTGSNPDKTAYTEESRKLSHLFNGENLRNGIIMAEILGRPKYLRKGRW